MYHLFIFFLFFSNTDGSGTGIARYEWWETIEDELFWANRTRTITINAAAVDSAGNRDLVWCSLFLSLSLSLSLISIVV